MAHRRYTKGQQATAVGVAIAEGQTAAAEKLGVPLSTIHTWYMKPEFVGLRTTARDEVAESMWIGVQIGIKAMVDGLNDPKVPLRDKTDAASMLAEKFLLLRGEATSRSEHRDISSSFDDEEWETLHTKLREWSNADV